MKNLKKLLAVVVAGALSLTMLVGCGVTAFDTKEMIDILNDAVVYMKENLNTPYVMIQEDYQLNVQKFSETNEMKNAAKNIALKVKEDVEKLGENGDVATYVDENRVDLIKLVNEKGVLENDGNGTVKISLVSFVKDTEYKSDAFNNTKTVLQMVELLKNSIHAGEIATFGNPVKVDANGYAGFYQVKINGETYVFAALQGVAVKEASSTTAVE